MKGALSSKPNYQFDAEGHLVKATEDEPDEVTFLKESIALYVEGQSPNHPADVAASNAPEEPPPPEALDVGGTRRVYSEEERANNDPAYGVPTPDEAEGEGDTDDTHLGSTHSSSSKRGGRRGR